MHIHSRWKVGNSKCLCQKRGHYKSDGVVTAGSCLTTTALYTYFSAIPWNLNSVLAEYTLSHPMKFQKNISVKLAEAGELFNNRIYFDLDETIRKLLILHEEREKEGKCIPFSTEMLVQTQDDMHHGENMARHEYFWKIPLGQVITTMIYLLSLHKLILFKQGWEKLLK